MKTFIVAVLAFTTVVFADPVTYGYRLVPIDAPAPAPAIGAPVPDYKTESYSTSNLNKSEIHDEAGQYSLSYVTANGIRVTERSYLKASNEGYVPVREGTYEYTSPDGTPVSFGYKADENGYVVKGYPLPLGPVPVPAVKV